jgi:hypothetical protein
VSDGPDALEKRKYTEPEWLQIGADRQHAVEEAEIAHEIAQNRIKSVRKPVMVAGILFLTSMALSAVGILTLITFLIGGGLAAFTLGFTLYQLKTANEEAGVTKYTGSTRQQLKRRQHEFYVWQQIDLADTGEYKKLEEKRPQLTDHELEALKSRLDSQKYELQNLRNDLNKSLKSLESGLNPKALTTSTRNYSSTRTNRYKPSTGQLYLDTMDGHSSLGGRWEIASTQNAMFLYKLHPGCSFVTGNRFSFFCFHHSVLLDQWSMEEFISALDEHDGCKLVIQSLPAEYKDNFVRSRFPYKGEIPRL